MSSKVIDILSKQPHLSGKAQCLKCKHEWIAVAPTGCVALECPECKLAHGVMWAMVLPPDGEGIWQCNFCEGVCFVYHERGVLVCVGCGADHEPWNN